MNRPEVFKIIVLGDSGVGKTSLVYRYCEGRNIQKVTIGLDVKERIVSVSRHRVCERVSLQFWDTAGQERYKQSLISSYFRHVDAVVLVYDVTQYPSFQSLESWMRELENHDLDKKPRILIGNKSDCPDVGHSIPIMVAQQFATKYDMQSFTTSAVLDSQNNYLDDIFMTLAKKLCNERSKAKTSSQEITSTEIIKLDSDNMNFEAKGNCQCGVSGPINALYKLMNWN